MRQFEIPYNYDMSVIDFIVENNYQQYISEVYTAPFIGDYSGAKRYYAIYDHTGILQQPTERSEYEKHTKKIVEAGLRLSVLFQNQEHILTNEMLQYYVNLGATVFVVNNDETAKMIKNFNPALRVIASITKKLSFKDFMEKDLSMYDEFVLYFPFNRSLDTIKQLPTKYKYILLVNCGCGYHCPGTFHWFAGCNEDGVEVVNGPCTSGRFEQTINVLPDSLRLFDPYIYKYKLQGREYSSDFLKADIKQYMEGTLNTDYVLSFRKEIDNLYTDEAHYNTATNNSPYLK